MLKHHHSFTLIAWGPASQVLSDVSTLPYQLGLITERAGEEQEEESDMA